MPRIDVLTFGAVALAGIAMPANACTVGTTPVVFGVYDPQSASPTDGTGAVDLACPPSVQSPVVALGTGGSGSFLPRRMTGGAFQLNYSLYTTAARVTIWGDGSSGTSILTLSGGVVSAGTRNFSQTIFGRITALQNVGAGSYSDTIIVTVTF